MISIKIRWKICIWTKSKQSADFCYDTLKIYVEAKSSNSDDNEVIQDLAARPPMLDKAIQNEAMRPPMLDKAIQEEAMRSPMLEEQQ